MTTLCTPEGRSCRAGYNRRFRSFAFFGNCWRRERDTHSPEPHSDSSYYTYRDCSPRSTTMKTFVVSPPLLLLLSLVWWADGFHAMDSLSLSMIVVPSLTKNRHHRRLPSPNQNPRNPRDRVSGTRFSQQQQQSSSASTGGRVPVPTTTTTTLQTVSGDLPTDPDKDESIRRRQKVYATTFNLVKAIAGSGILALPGGVAAMSDYKSR